MGRIDLDAGESRKIIAESVDAVEEFVEAVSGEIFLSEKSTVPSDSADPIPEGDRTDVTAREGTAVYARAAPRGSGAEIRVGNAGNGINVSRRARRVVEGPTDRAARRGEVSRQRQGAKVVNSASIETVLSFTPPEDYRIDSVNAINIDSVAVDNWYWILEIDTTDEGYGRGENGQYRTFDPPPTGEDGEQVKLRAENLSGSDDITVAAVVDFTPR
jgi:hypothetical protein